ncbi:MAG: alpha-galactosidase [Cellulomonadaceae bacterium]|nr:alpha-galactosidase [Cellulomonadaceae bacterium]
MRKLTRVNTTALTPVATTALPAVMHLRAAGVSVLVDARGPRMPRVVYWGDDLDEVTESELTSLVSASRPPAVHNSIDEPEPIGVVAEPSGGWFGIPGLAGHRDGVDFTTRFELVELESTTRADGGAAVIARGRDTAVELALRLHIELATSGLVSLRAELTNTGTTPYVLDGLRLTLPLPARAEEILDFTGRHTRERSPQRHRITLGSYVRTGRKGRTGSDSTLLLAAGVTGFGFERGEIWATHVAWSGNHTTYIERDSLGRTTIGGGEELLPGEVRLQPGDTYCTPTVFGAYADGLDGIADRFHTHLRARPSHPVGPRPVTLNTWEAVYFAQDHAKLARLAERAAGVGVERFVLDDGWFRGRRDETAGLGDWQVDLSVWPEGLGPLVSHVRSLGMQFGLWFEPEMVSEDSDLARAHPDWILSAGVRRPLESRHQQVLDLGHPGAFSYVLEAMSALIAEHDIDYIKWDHNRDLVDPGHSATRRAAVHEQTLAAYRLMDELRSRHLGLEIESCSSGGARVDLGVLDHTDRIWASDSIDALERQQIQRWTGLVVPPEMMGTHVGAPTSHTTGRTHTLGFRTGTALFGHFGIEWDLDQASAAELAELHGWVDLHRRFRKLLHTGRVVHTDHPDPALWVAGVVDQARREALYSIVSVSTGVWSPPGHVRLTGLEPATRYRVTLLDTPSRSASSMPAWSVDGVVATGRSLGRLGVQSPDLRPETLELLHVTAVPTGSSDPS